MPETPTDIAAQLIDEPAGVTTGCSVPRGKRAAFVPLLTFCVFALVAWHLLETTRFPAPDELQHISYAAFLQQTNRLLPQFAKQKTLEADDFSRWNARPNYIGHPSPFYLLIGLSLDRTLPPDQAVMAPRLVSATLLLCGVALTLWAGFESFRRDRVALLLFCLIFAFCPELVSVSRQVTNDSLAVLGGALAYWGASSADRRWSAYAAGLGLVLALWAKLNAGLEMGLLLPLVLALQRPLQPRWLGALAVSGLIGAVPYFLFLRDDGSLVPVTAESIGHFIHMGSLADYSWAFPLRLGYTWGLHWINHWPITRGIDILTVVLFWAMMACTVFTAAIARRALPEPGATVALAAPLAFFAVLPIQFWFAATSLGYSLPAASFRYYLPLWPALAHSLAYSVVSPSTIWSRAVVTAIGGAALGCGLACGAGWLG